MRIQRATSAVAALLLVSAVAVAACGSSAAPNSSGATNNPGATDVAGGVPNLPAAGGGSCSVSITGDVTASWTAKQDMSSVLVTYWLSSAEKAVAMLSPGEEYFLLNCKGAQGSLSLYNSGGTTAAQFTKGAGTYVIAAGGLLGGGNPGQVSALVTIGKDALWKIPEPGNFTVTTLDGSRFAGSFQVKIAKVGDDLKTVTATATLSGTFDFHCTAGGCG